MPAARGVKRAASKASTTAAASASKNKKKRTGVQLGVPQAPKKRGCVLTCGQGDVGQLGLGEDVVETTKFQLVSTLGSKIVDARAGGMHTVALDSDGTVWTFGCNDEGALGRATRGEADEGVPGRVALPGPAVAIAAGDSHTAALLDNGDVYAWGAFRDSHGTMGLVVQGREGKACREPAHIPLGEPAADLASGGDHLVVLTVSGSVFTMGCGEQGQLGRLSQRSATRDARQGFNALLVPSKVILRPGASRVWAGYHATFVLDGNGEKVYAWGLNNYGQLGVSGEKRRAALFTPTECDMFTRGAERWADVACGQHHSLALDSTGTCYAVGRCEYGRLGLGDRSGDAEALEAIPKLGGKRCVSIAAGTSSSFAVTDKGEVYAWGMGSEGQLGTGATEDASEPCSITALPTTGKPARASAGGQHTVLLLEDTSEPKASTPEPVSKEPETQKVKETEENEEEEEKPRPAKRQKKKDEDISSSSDAKADVAVDAGPRPPEKINGAETKTTAMEVDETDKKEPDIEKEVQETENTTTTDKKQEHSEPEEVTTKEIETKPETIDTDKKESEQPMETETDAPVAEVVAQGNDVEMKPEEKGSEINGNPETEVVVEKTKPVQETTISSDNTLTTTA